MIEKTEKRTKILSLSSGTFLVYQIPGVVSADVLKFIEEDGRLLLTDGKDLTMNVTERSRGGACVAASGRHPHPQSTSQHVPPQTGRQISP